MQPQHGWKLKIIDCVFAALKNSDDLKGISVVLGQETLWMVKICGGIVGILMCAREHEELEVGIGGHQVLYVYLVHVSGAHKYVQEKVLANGEA